MSDRLTNMKVNGILSRLLEHKYNDLLEKLREDKMQLAQDIYNFVFDEKARNLMATLPADWLPLTSGVSFCVGDEQDYRHLELREDLPVPYGKHAGCMVVLDRNSELGTRALELKERAVEISRQRQEDKKNALAILSSVTTIPALLRLWPEVAPFIETNEKPRPKLPAVPITDLNKSFGLPVS